MQVDDIDNTPINDEESKQIFKYIQQSNTNVLAIADYRHGLLSPKLIELINTSNKRIILDSQVSKSPANHHMYKHIYLTLLNENLIFRFWGVTKKTDNGVSVKKVAFLSGEIVLLTSMILHRIFPVSSKINGFIY